jgi:hypothetical protein
MKGTHLLAIRISAFFNINEIGCWNFTQALFSSSLLTCHSHLTVHYLFCFLLIFIMLVLSRPTTWTSCN